VASDGSGNLYGIKPENEWLYFLDHESGFEIMESERIRDFYVNLVEQKLERAKRKNE
jgi:hypothetical protein